MNSKSLKLSDQELQQYAQIENSIAHWSSEHTKSALQTNRLLGAVNSMYEGRMTLMNGFLKAQGLDPAHVHQVHVDSDTGGVSVTYDESVPNPAADPSESGELSPTASPVG